MSTLLITLIKEGHIWIVVDHKFNPHASNQERSDRSFPTIELASEYMMESLSIKDEAIDDALCEMYALGHDKAIFSNSGNFIATKGTSHV